MSEKTRKLPEPRLFSDWSIEQCLARRRSVRAYRSAPVSLQDTSQLLWSVQGLTGPQGQRAAPSAGALYPLETYLVCSRVTGLDPGIYRYQNRDHSLLVVAKGDVLTELATAALGQQAVLESALVLCLSAVERRITWKYGRRGLRYIDLETGHAAQNACLQAVALDLGSVVVGAFDEGKVRALLHLRDDEAPLYLICFGHPVDA